MSEENEAVVEIAEEMGWQKDFKGPGAKSAKDYILAERAISNTQSRTIKNQNSKLNDLSTKVDTLVRKYSVSEINKKKDAIHTARDEAIEDGDATKVKEFDKELKTLDQEEQHQNAPAQNHEQRAKDFDRGAEEFGKDHPWWDSKEKSDKALDYGRELMSADPNMSADDFFQEMATWGVKTFPEDYENKNRERGDGLSGDTKKKRTTAKTSWDQLKSEHPEAEQLFMDFVSDNIFEDTPEGREEYAKTALGAE